MGTRKVISTARDRSTAYSYYDSLPESRHGLLSDTLAKAESFTPDLVDLVQCAHVPDMRIRCISRAKLAGAHGRPTTFSVVSGAGVAAGAGGKDCGLAYLSCEAWEQKTSL